MIQNQGWEEQVSFQRWQETQVSFKRGISHFLLHTFRMPRHLWEYFSSLCSCSQINPALEIERGCWCVQSWQRKMCFSATESSLGRARLPHFSAMEKNFLLGLQLMSIWLSGYPSCQAGLHVSAFVYLPKTKNQIIDGISSSSAQMMIMIRLPFMNTEGD